LLAAAKKYARFTRHGLAAPPGARIKLGLRDRCFCRAFIRRQNAESCDVVSQLTRVNIGAPDRDESVPRRPR
jgi:hypothetical protein